MAPSIQQLLSSHRQRLTAADRKLAEILLGNPRQAAFLSTNEIASRAEVHPTSAVRLARKLGFNGYPALRATLQNDLFDESAAAERVRQRIERLGRDEVLRAFVASEIRALERLPEQVRDADIINAARAIVRSRTVFLHGTGHSETLVRLMQIRLLRGGYGAVVLPGDTREAAALMLQAKKHDVFMMFVFFAPHTRAARLTEHARKTGARSVIITDIMNPATLPHADIVLSATRGDPGEARSLTVPMAICNTMMLQVSKLDGGRMIRNLEELETARITLEDQST
ncbi:MAG: MurR/RpiR family transcriptional regulator [Burkholderiales bacterium]